MNFLVPSYFYACSYFPTFYLFLGLSQKFLEMDVLVEGLSLETPTYVVSEGHEPPFFTRFFEWDPSKSNVRLFAYINDALLSSC